MTRLRKKNFRLMVAGGGTGGHLFPGVAVAEEFLRRDPGAEVLFVGTGRPVEAEVLSKRNLKSRTIMAKGLKGKGLWNRIQALVALPVGFLQSIGVILSFKPDLVLGVGGYVSGPLVLAARLLGRTTAIQEQNSVPGMTNRILGRIVDLVFVGFDASRKYFPASKTRLTGNPIREEIKAEANREKNFDGPFTLLVAGGSLGAHALNLAVADAVTLLASEGVKPRLIHQTGAADFEMVQKTYRDIGLEAEVKPFFQDMERAYREASLVICRAGALTVAETAVMGLPAIFSPLPWAADNHQEYNARFLTDAGAAEIMHQRDMTPDALAAMIKTLAADKGRLKQMSEAAKIAARPNAVGEICDICEAQAKKRGRRGE